MELRNNEEYEIKPLNLLAFPRDFSPICELSGEKAKVQLITPYGTMFYASDLAAEQAWQGIIKKIAHLLPPLMQPAPIVGTSEERAKRSNHLLAGKRQLIEFCQSEASVLLSVHKYQLVIPAAIQALKFCRELDGDRSMSTIEPYLQLAQAFLGLHEFNKAEQYVAQAHWIVLNTPDCTDRLKYRLYILSGRAKAARGDFNEAKVQFASAIYFASRAFGAEAIFTSFGYFRIGDVFLAQGQAEIALDFYDKVVDIWYKYLTALYSAVQAKKFMVVTSSATNNDLQVATDDIEKLTEEQLSEGKAQLQQILEHRRRLLGESHITVGESRYTLGLFDYFLLNKPQDAEVAILSALHSYEVAYGANHPSTKHVMDVMTLLLGS